MQPHANERSGRYSERRKSVGSLHQLDCLVSEKPAVCCDIKLIQLAIENVVFQCLHRRLSPYGGMQLLHEILVREDEHALPAMLGMRLPQELLGARVNHLEGLPAGRVERVMYMTNGQV